MPGPVEFSMNELAGLPPDGKPHSLTLEDAYKLALVLARAPSEKPPLHGKTRFDPAALQALSQQYGVSDFEQFHRDFEAQGVSETGRFHDPGPAYLELLILYQKVATMRGTLATLEQLHMAVAEASKGGASGFSQADVDRFDAEVQQTRGDLLVAIDHYRDSLDTFRAQLGLSPNTEVVIDRQLLEPFQRLFSQFDVWFTSEDRLPEEIVAMTGKLPSLGDLVLQQHSMRAGGDLEGFLRAGEAMQAQGANTDEQALRVRRRLRGLHRTATLYDVERNLWIVTLRQRDDASRRFLAPARPGDPDHTALSNQVNGLLQATQRDYACRRQLVRLWGTFMTDRLALDRELAILPFDNGTSFLGSFAPVQTPGKELPPTGEKP
jgi:hypothetical protein